MMDTATHDARWLKCWLMVGLLMALPVVGQAAPIWTLELAPGATVAGAVARLTDVAMTGVPEQVASLAVAAGGLPGDVRLVSRRSILRQLVLAGQADGLRLAGAEVCTLRFAGGEVEPDSLLTRVRAALATLIPPPGASAPDSWLEVTLPGSRLTASDGWRVTLERIEPLTPGRNLVPVLVCDGPRRQRVTATVVLHAFGAVPTVTRTVPRGTAVLPEALSWAWQDLATASPGLVGDPSELDGTAAAHDLRAGTALSRNDLAVAPMVHRGDAVELVLRRGGVSVVVRGLSRQDGRLGQVITVRNEANGGLVTGRVVGPGRVELQRGGSR